MDVVVDGTPEYCVAQVEACFVHRWPYGGTYTKPTLNTINLVARAPQHRYMVESSGGRVLFLILSLITGGTFFGAYLIYLTISDTVSSAPPTHLARVVATAKSPTKTRLSVSASRGDWTRTLEGWVPQELVEHASAAEQTSIE